MPVVIRKSPDLLGAKYMAPGASNRYLISCRDSRKIVNVNSSNFGGILSSTSVAAAPGAVVYIAGTVYCIGEDGYLRSFTQTVDTLSAVVSTINVYTANSNWLWAISTTIVCPWGFDGVQLIVAGVVTAQRASGLARIQNAFLNESRLYCFDGNGVGVVLTISGSTITQGEKFAVPSGVNVDCIGLISASVLGIGANSNPQYITLSLTDPDVPVWASRTLQTDPIAAIIASGPLISTDVAPLSSSVGVYDVEGGVEPLATNYMTAVNAGLIADFAISLPVSSLALYNFNGTLFDTNGLNQLNLTSGSVAYGLPAVGLVGFSLATPPTTVATLDRTFTTNGGHIISIAGWFKRTQNGGPASLVSMQTGSNLFQMQGPIGSLWFDMNSTSTTATAVPDGAWVHLAFSANQQTGKFSYWVNGVEVQTLATFALNAEGGNVICNLTVLSYSQNWEIDNFYIGEVFLTTGNVLALKAYID